MCVGSPTAGAWSSFQRRPGDEFETDRRHEDDILNYFRMPIDNGTVEGVNNKAKLVIHKAYGFRTAKNYIRNLYHCLGNLSLPQTVHTFV